MKILIEEILDEDRNGGRQCFIVVIDIGRGKVLNSGICYCGISDDDLSALLRKHHATTSNWYDDVFLNYHDAVNFAKELEPILVMNALSYKSHNYNKVEE